MAVLLSAVVRLIVVAAMVTVVAMATAMAAMATAMSMVTAMETATAAVPAIMMMATLTAAVAAIASVMASAMAATTTAAAMKTTAATVMAGHRQQSTKSGNGRNDGGCNTATEHNNYSGRTRTSRNKRQRGRGGQAYGCEVEVPHKATWQPVGANERQTRGGVASVT
jgi:hypothetical protein